MGHSAIIIHRCDGCGVREVKHVRGRMMGAAQFYGGLPSGWARFWLAPRAYEKFLIFHSLDCLKDWLVKHERWSELAMLKEGIATGGPTCRTN